MADIHDDNVPSITTLLAFCKGIVTVDKKASTLRLVDFTLSEYLQALPEHFDRPHAAMAETCLSYLNSHQVKVLLYNSSPNDLHLQDTAFLEYSSVYWGVHAKGDISDRANCLRSVFPSVQSVRLSPKTGRTPSLRPLDGTDAQLQSILTFGRDGRPGPIGVLVYVSFSNFMSIMSVLLRSETFLF